MAKITRIPQNAVSRLPALCNKILVNLKIMELLITPWPPFINQECYIPNFLFRRAVFKNSSCDFFRSLFKVKVQGQRLKIKGLNS